MRAPHESVNRKQLKDLIDSMRDDDLPAIKRYLQFLRYLDDPVARSLAEAPVDDDGTTEEDIAAFRKTDDDFRTGDVATQEDLEACWSLARSGWRLKSGGSTVPR